MAEENITGQREPSMRPEPDPTPRTLEQLYREIELLGEKSDAQLAALAEKNAETFRAMDKALILLQQFADKSPTTSNVDGKVDALTRFVDQKIEAARELSDIKSSFIKEMSEIRVGYTKEIAEIKNAASEALTNAKFQGNQTALDAALKTQKEASDKIEQNFTKQFENMGSLINTSVGAISQQIADMKERVGGVEGGNRGNAVQKQDDKDNRGFIVGVIGAVVGLVMMFIAVGAVVIAVAGNGVGP